MKWVIKVLQILKCIMQNFLELMELDLAELLILPTYSQQMLWDLIQGDLNLKLLEHLHRIQSTLHQLFLEMEEFQPEKLTVTTQEAHGLNVGTPIIVEGVTGENAFNISTKVTGIDNTNDKIFTYSITADPATLSPGPFTDQGKVKIETDTVSGASPYIFNISLRSVWGMNGMHTDGSKATGFRSMVVAQFTGVSLTKRR